MNLFEQYILNRGMEYKEADDEAAEVWEKIQCGVDFQDTLEYFMEMYSEELTDQKLEKLVQLLQDANNHTRMQIHRGYTPMEMMEMDMSIVWFLLRIMLYIYAFAVLSR